MGGSAHGPADAGALLGANVDCAVADRFLPLYLVALHLYAELGRSGQPGCCGLILLFAETYAWIVLVLGYFQVVWPLNRQPVPLPKDMSLWPSVDIFVPTYNEDLNVVKNTIYASLGIDWPKDKLDLWILDDGGREEFRQFAQNVGVKYIARTTHEHAKAGNINNALKYAKGEFVSVDFRLRPRTNAIVLANDHGLVPERKTAGDDADAAPLLTGPV